MQLTSSGMEPVRSSGPAVKEQVVDKIPKRFKELKFGVQYVIMRLPLLCILARTDYLDPHAIL